MRIRLGRDFSDRDNQTATTVAIINEAAARKYFPNANPIGSSSVGRLEIVGVLRDAKYDSIRDPVPTPSRIAPKEKLNSSRGCHARPCVCWTWGMATAAYLRE
jgi:hypothetical protein